MQCFCLAGQNFRTALIRTGWDSDSDSEENDESAARNDITGGDNIASDGDGLSDTPAVGRISNAATELVRTTYQEVLQLAKNVHKKTGLSTGQVMDQWLMAHSRTTTKGNAWNLYSAYFKANMAKELARIKSGDPDVDPLDANSSRVREQCYTAFKAKYGDKAQDILDTFYSMQQASQGQQQTVAQRRKVFKKCSTRVTDMMNSFEDLHGFSGAVILIGRSVNSDGNLAMVHATTNAEGFFKEKCRATDDVIIGHMKAHVYNRVSEAMVELDWDVEPRGDTSKREHDKKAPGKKQAQSRQQPQDAISRAARPGQPETVAQSSPVRTVGLEDNADLLLDRKDKPKYICQRLRAMLEEHGAELKGTLFPWKSLPSVLAMQGLLIYNWPEDVPWPLEPGDAPAHKQPKGITTLKSGAINSLLAGLKAKAHRIRVEAYDGSNIDLLSSEVPVIYGAPPAATSVHTHARRLFRDGKVDRNGRPRDVATSSSNHQDGALFDVEDPVEDSTTLPLPHPPTPGPSHSHQQLSDQPRDLRRKPRPRRAVQVDISTTPKKAESSKQPPSSVINLDSSESASEDDYLPSPPVASERVKMKRKAPASWIGSNSGPSTPPTKLLKGASGAVNAGEGMRPRASSVLPPGIMGLPPLPSLALDRIDSKQQEPVGNLRASTSTVLPLNQQGSQVNTRPPTLVDSESTPAPPLRLKVQDIASRAAASSTSSALNAMREEHFDVDLGAHRDTKDPVKVEANLGANSRATGGANAESNVRAHAGANVAAYRREDHPGHSDANHGAQLNPKDGVQPPRKDRRTSSVAAAKIESGSKAANVGHHHASQRTGYHADHPSVAHTEIAGPSLPPTTDQLHDLASSSTNHPPPSFKATTPSKVLENLHKSPARHPQQDVSRSTHSEVPHDSALQPIRTPEDVRGRTEHGAPNKPPGAGADVAKKVGAEGDADVERDVPMDQAVADGRREHEHAGVHQQVIRADEQMERAQQAPPRAEDVAAAMDVDPVRVAPGPERSDSNMLRVEGLYHEGGRHPQDVNAPPQYYPPYPPAGGWTAQAPPYAYGPPFGPPTHYPPPGGYVPGVLQGPYAGYPQAHPYHAHAPGPAGHYPQHSAFPAMASPPQGAPPPSPYIQVAALPPGYHTGGPGTVPGFYPHAPPHMVQGGPHLDDQQRADQRNAANGIQRGPSRAQ
ncbi:hypothetical protein FKP32DRAFT_1677206 [Trametes sanguinea]|nr:hypothetical protein FKP32DRAFT_1677206 [Trametes sanguinea]